MRETHANVAAVLAGAQAAQDLATRLDGIGRRTLLMPDRAS